jgi:hypothetical protein
VSNIFVIFDVVAVDVYVVDDGLLIVLLSPFVEDPTSQRSE